MEDKKLRVSYFLTARVLFYAFFAIQCVVYLLVESIPITACISLFAQHLMVSSCYLPL